MKRDYSNPKPTIIDLENFSILRDELGVGRIKELSAEDAGLLAAHIGQYAETVYVAASGFPFSGEESLFKYGETCIGIEWVRRETNRRPNEPELNSYRYVFGYSPSDNQCWGYDVTEYDPVDSHSNPIPGQVLDHWIDLERLVQSLPNHSRLTE